MYSLNKSAALEIAADIKITAIQVNKIVKKTDKYFI